MNGQTSDNEVYENDDNKRAGGRGFDGSFNSNPLISDKRAGGRGFLMNSITAEAKRGGARGFSNNEEYHSAERRAGGRTFLMPGSADEVLISNKRAGGRPFYGMPEWKRAGGRLFHFYDAPMIKRAGGRGFYSDDNSMEKRAGGRAFAHYFGENAFFPKRGGSRPFYATNSWRGYPL